MGRVDPEASLKALRASSTAGDFRENTSFVSDSLVNERTQSRGIRSLNLESMSLLPLTLARQRMPREDWEKGNSKEEPEAPIQALDEGDIAMLKHYVEDISYSLFRVKVLMALTLSEWKRRFRRC